MAPMMFRLAVVAGLIAYAAALTSSCQSALFNIAGNADAAQCLAIPLLLPVVAATNTSIIGPLNTWAGTMCSRLACNNVTLAAVVTNLTSGCSTDLNISSGASLIPSVQSAYPTIRKIFCLVHTGTNNLCITETLKNVEEITGPLSLANIEKLYETPPTSLPSNITCTDCNKEVYNTWARDIPSSVSTAKPALESQCNATFVDGSTPSGISQSANTGVASSTSLAFSLLDALTNSAIMAVGASGFVALSTLYTILI